MGATKKYFGMRLLLLLANLFAFACGSDNDGNPYITSPDDYDAANAAAKAAAKQCKGGFVGAEELADSRKDRQETLEEAVGGDNIIATVLEKSDTPEDMGTVASEEVSMGWLITKAGPLILLFVLLPIYCLCCWTACPFCKVLRIGAKERKTNLIVFLVGFVLIFLIGFGVIISGSVAVTGHAGVSDGFQNMGCSTALLLNMTLSGENDPQFIGMLPMLQTFNTLDGLLDEGSTFIIDMNALLDSTQELDTAVAGASGILGLLSSTLALPGNAQPSAGGTDLKHECQFCTKVAEAVAPVQVALESGAGKSLQNARSEVKEQLSGQAKTDLQGTLRAAASPIMMVKDMFRDTFGGLVGDDMESMQEQVAGDGVKGGIVLILLCAMLLTACSLASFVSFYLCGPNKRAVTDEKTEEKQKNPYSKLPVRISCYTWCCAFYLIFVALLFGGILTMLTVPFSGVCLIMHDINAASLRRMGGALGMNMSATGNDMDMVFDIIDNCFAETDPSANANLLDIVKTTNENGTLVSIREEVVEGVKDQIKNQFVDATSKMTSGNATTMATSPEVTSLRNMLALNDVRVMILPAASMASDSIYNPLANAQSGAANIQPLASYMTTGVSCTDETPAGVPGFSSAVPGLNTFDTALTNLGTTPVNTYGDSCADKVTCSGGAICQAANAYLDLKQKIRSVAQYRCDLFEDPDNPAAYCDPKDMTASYLGDCMTKANGEVVPLKPKQKDCNLVEFKQYIQDFDVRIQKTFARMDVKVASVGPTITGTLQSLVKQFILDEIDVVADGAGCWFMTKTYRSMIDGFCYQGVYGLIMIANAYVATAVLCLIMILILYTLWRVSADNYNKWKPSEEVVILPRR